MGCIAVLKGYYLFMTLAALLCLTWMGEAHPRMELVHNMAELRLAIRRAKPGTTISLAPGKYEAGFYASNIHGEKGRPITIRSANPKRPAIFGNTGTGIQLSRVSFLTLEHLDVEGCSDNGINIDDGGDPSRPSRGIILRDLNIKDIAKGNHDGIKLSGVREFEIENVRVQNWGGSAIDMVGCHDGVIRGSRLEKGGDNGVQAKGGSSKVTIERCQFIETGQRGVNIGGSTGFDFFRPSLSEMSPGERYEAKDITVQGCLFVGAMASAAFVGVNGAKFEFNTIDCPNRWAFRILQETRDPSFLPSRGGVVARNLILFNSSRWSEGGVNIGPGTDPSSFRFEQNFWFCQDRPEASRPRLPSPEVEGTYGVDPKVERDPSGFTKVPKSSPAIGVGAHAFKGRSP